MLRLPLDDRCEVGVSIWRAGGGGEFHARGFALAPLSPDAVREQGTFLAVRGLGDSFRTFRRRGSLSLTLDAPLSAGWTERRPARWYSVAAWLQRADLNGSFARYLDPPLTAEERANARASPWGICKGVQTLCIPPLGVPTPSMILCISFITYLAMNLFSCIIRLPQR